MLSPVCYAFGKHSIQIHNHLENACLAHYRAQSRQASHVALKLVADNHLLPTDHIPGWSERLFGKTKVVSFCNEYDQLFQLQYATDDYTNILLHYNPERMYSLSLGIQHAMMIALSEDTIGLHGVTVICGGKALILSAPSGTGKTTLANLLQKYCGAAIVNGDFALLSLDSEYGVVFEPTPFCGTSNTCHNVRLPISGIVFLEQSVTPEWKVLSTRDSLIHLLSNMFVPQWDEKLQQSVESIAMQIIPQVTVCKFAFPPTEEAAKVFYHNVIL